ncbi:hypothetical protein JL721_4097 [Aureococcus anophagefferens]|nr:hypothetical protein JL721_4097 [Aureococcus anophagefferens]
MAGPTLDDFAGRSPTVGDLAPPPSSRRRARPGRAAAPARAPGGPPAPRDAPEPRPSRRLALSPPDAEPRAPPSVVSVASAPPVDAVAEPATPLARAATPESAAESRRTWSERSDDRRGRDRGGWHAESPQSLYTATSDPDLSRSLGRAPRAGHVAALRPGLRGRARRVPAAPRRGAYPAGRGGRSPSAAAATPTWRARRRGGDDGGDARRFGRAGDDGGRGGRGDARRFGRAGDDDGRDHGGTSRHFARPDDDDGRAGSSRRFGRRGDDDNGGSSRHFGRPGGEGSYNESSRHFRRPGDDDGGRFGPRSHVDGRGSRARPEDDDRYGGTSRRFGHRGDDGYDASSRRFGHRGDDGYDASSRRFGHQGDGEDRGGSSRRFGRQGDDGRGGTSRRFGRGKEDEDDDYRSRRFDHRSGEEGDRSRRFGHRDDDDDYGSRRLGHRDDDNGYGSRRFGRRQRDDHPRRDGSGDDDDAHGGASRRFGRAARRPTPRRRRADAVATALAGGAAAVRGPPPGRDVVSARAAGRASPEEAYARFTARRSPERAATSRDRSVDLKRYARHADSDSDGEHRSVAAAELLNEATASALDMRGAKMGAKLLATEKELASRSARVLGPACGVVGPDGRSATLVALEAAHAAAKADGAGERHTLVALLGDEIRLQEKHERRLAALDDDLDAAKARDDFERCILLEKERKEAVASRRGLLEAIAVASSERSPRRELDVLEEELVNRRTAADLATAAPKPKLKRHEDPEPLAEEVARSNLVKAGPLGVFDEATSAWSSRDVELATDPADATSASLYMNHARRGTTPEPEPRRFVVWEERHDPASGRAYYFCPETGVSSWEMPAELAKAAAADDDADDGRLKRMLSQAPRRASHVNESLNLTTQFEADAWEERADPATGRSYYFNAQTGESTWSPPANALIRRAA